MTTHTLKCWPDHFGAIFDGRKRCEVRYNDRDYAEGDILVLFEWSPEAMMHTGRKVQVRVTHVLELAHVIGLDAGAGSEEGQPWAVMSIVTLDCDGEFSREWLERG